MRSIVLTICVLLYSMLIWGQSQMNLRWNNNGLSVRGDFTIIGNNTVSLAANTRADYPPFNTNHNVQMGYIDIDNDPTTFQSSSASVNIPSKFPDCLRVKWAGLYWGGYLDDNTRNIDKVKIKLPGQTQYIDLVADNLIDKTEADLRNYEGFKDITHLLKGKSPNGNYVVADVSSITGHSENTISAGWALVIVYEDIDPSVIDRKISIYDGNVQIVPRQNQNRVNIPITGFQTIPHGDVNVRLGVVAWEGDNNVRGDSFLINNNKIRGIGDINSRNNFFDSNITIDHRYNENREPNSRSTFGWDIDVFTLNNPNNSILGNNAQNVNLTLTSERDVYALYLTAFSVETIAPKIELKKEIKGIDPNTGQSVDFQLKPVAFNQALSYEMSFQNTGNDDAVSVQLIDILPANVNLVHIDAFPQGVSLLSQEDIIVDGALRKKIILNIADNLMVKNGPKTAIRINVRVVGDCRSVRDACSNEIKNIASITYQSASDVRFNIDKRYEAESFNGRDACSKSPESTNFLISDPNCEQEIQRVATCQSRATLVAGNGYASYIWKKQGSDVVIGQTQTLTVNEVGIYTVSKSVYPDKAYCSNRLVEVFEVYAGMEFPDPIENIATTTQLCDAGIKKHIISLSANGPNEIDLSNLQTNQIKWYRYIDPNYTQNSCPISREDNPALWEEVNDTHSLSLNKDFNQEQLYSVEVIYTQDSNCPKTYYFHISFILEVPEYDVHFEDTYCTTNAGLIRFELKNPDLANTYVLKYGIKKQNQPDWIEQDTPIFTSVEQGVYQLRITYQKGRYTYVNEQHMVTISQINDPVEAFVGLSQLSCLEQGGQISPARVRVVNVKGGAKTANDTYQYKFGDNNWTNQNEADLLPGNYIIKVKSAKEHCVFTTTLQVPEPLPVPEYTKSLTYDCQGRGVLSFTPNNTDLFEYSYAQDGTPDQWNTDDTHHFTELPQGNHILKVHYRQRKINSVNLLIEENFGQGEDTPSVDVPNYYTFESQNNRNQINDGEYSITKKVKRPHVGWVSPIDHTGLADGRFLVINIGDVSGEGGVIYKKAIHDFLPDTPIKFQLFAFNIIGQNQTASDPQLTVELVTPTGKVIDRIPQVNIPKNRNASDWFEISSDDSKTLNPQGHTSLFIQIRSNRTDIAGNDLAIDDIRAYQEPKACVNTLSIEVEVEPNKEFRFSDNAQIQHLLCWGDTNATAIFSFDNLAQQQPLSYQLLKEGNPLTPDFVETDEQQITLTDLQQGNYTLKVKVNRYGECLITRDFTIDAPNLIQINQLQTQIILGCKEDEKILPINNLVTIEGGVPPYTYSIEPTQGAILNQAQQTITISSKGQYIVTVTDRNGCSKNFDFSVEKQPKPQIEIVKNQGVSCFGNTDGVIQFRVDEQQDNPPYTYVLFTKKNRIEVARAEVQIGDLIEKTNLASGVYLLEVTNAIGCSSIQEITINQKNNLETTSVQVVRYCNDNTPIYDVYVTFADWVSADYQYSINQEQTLRNFTRIDANDPHILVIENVQIPEGEHQLTIHYKGCKQQANESLRIDIPSPIVLINQSEATEVNKIRVKVQGGVSPYEIYFAPANANLNDLNTAQMTLATLDNDNQVSFVFQRNDAGRVDHQGRTYKSIAVVVRDQLGCTHSIIVEKEYLDIEIPNFFTPNADGQNDFWYVKNASNYKELSVDIFDRYGRFIVKLKSEQSWDGTYKQRPLPTGDYWYIIHCNEPNDDRQFKGHFTLYR